MPERRAFASCEPSRQRCVGSPKPPTCSPTPTGEHASFTLFVSLMPRQVPMRFHHVPTHPSQLHTTQKIAVLINARPATSIAIIITTTVSANGRFRATTNVAISFDGVNIWNDTACIAHPDDHHVLAVVFQPQRQHPVSLCLCSLW